MTWALIGWLLPTLILMVLEPPPPEQQPERSNAGRLGRLARIQQLLAAACDRVEAALEAWLRRLLPRPQLHPAGEQVSPGSCALSWVLTLCGLWLLCCAAVPLYTSSGGGGDPRPL